MTDIKQWKVCTYCNTFNQAPFIAKTVAGFEMQHTVFSAVYCIIDDASTDGEQMMLREWAKKHLILLDGYPKVMSYGELYYGRSKNNIMANFAILLLKENHYGKNPTMPYISQWYNYSEYIAICEGDDYWIDEAKLQKQVDFLDAHQHYSAVAGNALKITEDGKEFGFFSTKSSRDLIDMGEIVRVRQFHTAAILYRREVYQQSPVKTITLGWDMWQWCCLMSQGPIRYENEVNCVYRCGTGVTSSTSKMKWIRLQEKWENILFKTFSPSYITYNDAFFPLLTDVFSVMTNKNTCKEDKEQLRAIFTKYITPSLFMELIPMMLRYYASKVKSLLIKRLAR